MKLGEWNIFCVELKRIPKISGRCLMNKLVCNYSVIRFLPYPETGEFANVGILACCPQIGWMDFAVEVRKTKRITDFFPELDVHMYTHGRQHLLAELKRLRPEFDSAEFKQLVLPQHQKMIAGIFAEIIRPREELFRFGAPATLLTEDPFKDLEALFDHYVDRNFAKHKDYQEKVMTDKLTQIFRAENLLHRYHSEKVGNDDYHVTLPFVESAENDTRPLRAIKPLNLTQTEATQIRDRGDAWRNRVDRLQQMDFLPRHMLFAVQCPPEADAKRYAAAREICDLLKSQGVAVEPFDNQRAVTHFASRTQA
ncbi:DUF3037 domain-containing protein [Verrucomicrobia bacterium S94]|nr:DUF3037 domain-containing protein [Verrucomicrobia bacterium S94]